MIVRKLLLWTLPLIVLTSLLTTVSTIAGRALRANAPELAYVQIPREGFDGELWLLDVERRLHLPLTSGQRVSAAPVWSPDGRWLAYVARPAGARTLLFLIDMTDGQTHLLSNPGNFDYAPAWSPDSSQLIFIGTRGHDAYQDLFLLRLADYDGDYGGIARTAINLTNTPYAEGGAAWSSDGERIAYLADVQGGRSLFTLDLATGGLTAVAVTAIHNDPPPVWLPDGGTLLYMGFTGIHSDLCTLPPALSAGICAGPSGDFDGYPALSPDGTGIAFIGERRGVNTLAWMSPDGGVVLRLAAGVRAAVPAWSPDGAWIAYSAVQDGREHLRRVRPDGSEDQVIVRRDGRQVSPAWRP